MDNQRSIHVTDDQLNFCQYRLRMMAACIPNPMPTEKPRVEFFMTGNLLMCKLLIGDFVVDEFFPEVYISGTR